MAKDAYYFSHDSNARNDDKILELRSKYGYEGYGLFWALIEVLRESTNYKIKFNNIKLLQISLAHPAKKLQSFIEFCINVGLLAKDNQFFWSERLLKDMFFYNEKKTILSESGKKGSLMRWGGDKGGDKGGDVDLNGKAYSNRVDKGNKGNRLEGTTLSLFSNFFINENDITRSVIDRANLLIEKYSFEEVEQVFEQVSKLDSKQRNIAYIEGFFNPKSKPHKQSQNSNQETQTQYRDLTPTYEEFQKGNS